MLGLSPEDRHSKRRAVHRTIHEFDRQDYFKFTFVRNPWDRVVSLWNQPAFRSINRLSGKSLKFFLEKYEPKSHEHGTTCHDYLNYGQMDFVGRFETRLQDLKYIFQNYDLIIDPGIHLKKTDHGPYQIYYDNQTRDLVSKKYRKDIEKFSYQF